MDYLEITQEDRDLVRERTNPNILIGKPVSLRQVKEDTTYFAYCQLGIRPYAWQMKFFDKFDGGNKRVMACTPRQVGKSTAVAIIALKTAIYNLRPDPVYKRSTVGIISATDDQSKKLIDDIRALIEKGDMRVSQLTGGKVKNFFSNQIDKKKTNNLTTITFTNGSRIICLPPTDKIRGYPFGLELIDEAAFIEEDQIYYEKAEPTVRATGGDIYMTSTPNGQHGFFFELFDPFEKLDKHEYDRMWIHYSMIDNQDEIKIIEEKKDIMTQSGRLKEFQQEYEASFTVDQSAFFESDKIDEGIDKDLCEVHSYQEPCDMGIDFGMTKCHSVITITTKDEETGVVSLLYQYEFPLDSDDNLIIPKVTELLKKFNIQNINVDDCPQGRTIIQQMENIGWNVTRFNFKREKIEKYTAFRSKLYKGMIKYYNLHPLLVQMKALQEVKNKVNVSIEKPRRGLDDRIDSFLISCYHYLEEGTPFESGLLMSQMDMTNLAVSDRSDKEWKKLKEKTERLLRNQPRTRITI